MNNILNKFYYGEINPSEKPALATKRYIENRELICSTENKLLEQFPRVQGAARHLHRCTPHRSTVRVQSRLRAWLPARRSDRGGAVTAYRVTSILSTPLDAS